MNGVQTKTMVGMSDEMVADDNKETEKHIGMCNNFLRHPSIDCFKLDA